MASSSSLPSTIAIIVGSSPSATEISDMPLEDCFKIAINNAWRIRKDFDVLVHPSDFAKDRMPDIDFSGKLVSNEDYMLAVNEAGGMIFAGATMTFATGYWVLENVAARLVGYFASDMVYPTSGEASHFYGNGSPDPLRKDVSLGSLEARGARLFAWGLYRNKLVVNFSGLSSSRLCFPRVPLTQRAKVPFGSCKVFSDFWPEFMRKAEQAWLLEKQIRFNALRTDYAKASENRSDVELIRKLDRLWEESIPLIDAGWQSLTAIYTEDVSD